MPGFERLDPENRLGEMRRAAVGKIVAIDRSDDDVIEAEIFDDEADVARLFGVERERLALIDGTKTAAARASVAENQKRRCLVAPALTDVRAARLFANRVQVFLAHELFEAKVVGITRRFDFDPVGMSARHGRSQCRRSRIVILHPRFFHSRPFPRVSSQTLQQSGGETDFEYARCSAPCRALVSWKSPRPKPDRME